jgi:hypothetical protein
VPSAAEVPSHLGRSSAKARCSLRKAKRPFARGSGCRFAIWLIGIGAAGSPRRTPPTPPDVRVRIRRFGELRLRGKPWDAEVVEVARGQGDVDLPA